MGMDETKTLKKKVFRPEYSDNLFESSVYALSGLKIECVKANKQPFDIHHYSQKRTISPKNWKIHAYRFFDGAFSFTQKRSPR